MMAIMANLRIGNKLLLAFALLILGFGAMLLFSLEQFVRLQQSEAHDQSRRHERVADVKDLLINILGQRTTLQALLSSEEVPHGDHLAQIQSSSQRNSQLLEHLRSTLSEDSEAVALVDKLEEVRNRFAHTRDTQVLPLLSNARNEEAAQLSGGIQKERVEQMTALGEQLTESDRGAHRALHRFEVHELRPDRRGGRHRAHHVV